MPKQTRDNHKEDNIRRDAKYNSKSLSNVGFSVHVKKQVATIICHANHTKCEYICTAKHVLWVYMPTCNIFFSSNLLSIIASLSHITLCFKLHHHCHWNLHHNNSQVHNLEQNMACNTLYFYLPYVNTGKSIKSKLVHDSGRKIYQNISYI